MIMNSKFYISPSTSTSSGKKLPGFTLAAACWRARRLPCGVHRNPNGDTLRVFPNKKAAIKAARNRGYVHGMKEGIVAFYNEKGEFNSQKGALRHLGDLYIW